MGGIERVHNWEFETIAWLDVNGWKNAWTIDGIGIG